MRNSTILRATVLGAVACLLLATAGEAQVGTRPPIRTPGRPAPNSLPARTTFVPKFEALAETRLLMEGLAHSNYQSLNRLLKEPPRDVDTWIFARGQALLIAETGNLLLLRPPRNTGRETWMKLAMAMRDQAGNLARRIAARDHAGSKAELAKLTGSCNRCHQTFRVNVRVAPAPEKEEPDTQ
jgi:hypothetical protein